MTELSGVAVSIEEVSAHLGRIFGRQHRPGNAPGWIAQELTFSQLRLLFHLRERGPVSIGRLADDLAVSVPTASGMVDRLERHGLVSRRHRSDDRRVVECALSEKGNRLVSEMAGARLEAIKRSLAVLNADELAEFDRLIRLIAARLAAAAAP